MTPEQQKLRAALEGQAMTPEQRKLRAQEQQKMRDEFLHPKEAPVGDWIFGLGLIAAVIGLWVVLPLGLLGALVLFVKWIWSW